MIFTLVNQVIYSVFMSVVLMSGVRFFFLQVTQEISDPSRVFRLLGSDRSVLMSEQP